MAKRKPLTASEKAFLSIYVRTDEKAAQIEAYRECGCAAATGPDRTVTGKINRLVARPDAQLVMDAEKAQRATIIKQKLAAADIDLADTILSAQEMRNATLNAMFEQLLEERKRLAVKDGDGNTKRSATGFSQIARELLKATAATGKTAGMSEDEAVAIFESMFEERKRFGSEDMPGNVNPEVEAKLAAAEAQLGGAE